MSRKPSTIHRAAIAAMIMAAATALCCQRQHDTPIPRRVAYPRVAPHDTVYSAVDSLPLTLMVNNMASVERESRHDGTVWLTLRYPLYRARIFCTLTPVTPSTVQSVVDNRAERVHLNLGGAAPAIMDIDSHGGYHANVVTASTATTPVQFISVRGDSPRWVVSGAVFMDGARAAAPTDSIAPVIRALEADVVRMMRSLSDI